jgi:Zn-dependent protease with chaperone function
MLDRFQERFTIFWIDKLLGGFRGKERYREDEIYLFSSDTPYAGMALPSFDIAINEKLVEEGNEKALEMVYHHESQHLRDHIISVLTGLSELVILRPGFLVLNFVFLSATSLVVLLGLYPAYISAEILLKIVSTDILISFSAVIISQIGEIRADLNALQKLGHEDMKQAKEDLRSLMSQPGWLTRLSLVLTHPTLEMVERVHRLTRGRKAEA